MTFPWDLFTTLISAPPIPPNRQDLLDFSGSGQIQSCRYINPNTQDFVPSSNGHFKGENAVDQEVSLALNTSFGSSSQNNFGQTFGLVKIITPGTTLMMTNALNQALSGLITTNRIILQNVSVTQPATNMINITFTYRNNTVGNTVTINFTLQNGIITNG